MSSLYKIRTDKRLDPERKKKNVARQKTTELRRARSVSFWAGDLDHRQDTEQLLNRYTYLYTPRYLYIHRYVKHALLLLISGQNQFILFYFIFLSSIPMLLCKSRKKYLEREKFYLFIYFFGMGLVKEKKKKKKKKEKRFVEVLILSNICIYNTCTLHTYYLNIMLWMGLGPWQDLSILLQIL